VIWVKNKGGYLVHFVPSLRILRAENGVIVEKGFGDFRVVLLGDGEIDGGDVLGVAVVWRCAEFQKGSVRGTS
jgi:hypothetical protein